eukprot:8255380-Pyramimonas_sp.AAC.1
MFDAKNGAAIDAHEAVFRFNREDRRMAHVKNMTLEEIAECVALPLLLIDLEGFFVLPTERQERCAYMGEKTTVRFVNRKYTDSLVNGDAAAGDYKPDEQILFWNLFTAPYFNHIQVSATPVLTRIYLQILFWNLLTAPYLNHIQ